MRILGFPLVRIANVEHFFLLAVGQMRRVLAGYARRAEIPSIFVSDRAGSIHQFA